MEDAVGFLIGRHFEAELKGEPSDPTLLNLGINCLRQRIKLFPEDDRAELSREILDDFLPRNILSSWGPEVAISYLHNFSQVTQEKFFEPSPSASTIARLTTALIRKGSETDAKDFLETGVAQPLRWNGEQKREVDLEFLGAAIQKGGVGQERVTAAIEKLYEEAEQRSDLPSLARSMASMIERIAAEVSFDAYFGSETKAEAERRLRLLEGTAFHYIDSSSPAQIQAFLACSQAYGRIGKEEEAGRLFKSAEVVFDQGNFLRNITLKEKN